ncbi:MAG: type III-B CRISPR module RAMP protein Cmr1, partial [Thermofilaceae archaeon]
MSKSDSLAQLQEILLRDELVCRLKIEAVTPIWIGGYDTEAVHEDLGRESLRSSSVKGVWRWWARSLISAATFESQNKFPSIKEADEVVSKLMGRGGESSSQSLYRITVEEEDVKYIILPNCTGQEYCHRCSNRSKEELDKLEEVARLNLYNLGKAIHEKRTSFIDTGSRFIISVYRQSLKPNEAYDAFIIHSLILALTLGGVGKANTRGFGKFKVLSIEIPSETVCKKIEEIVYEQMKEIESASDAQKIIEELLKKGVSFARNILGNESVTTSSDLPLFETPVDGFFQISVPDITFDSDLLALKSIGYATLKSEWKKAKRGFKTRGIEFDTWILGLPRFLLNLVDAKFDVNILKQKLLNNMIRVNCSSKFAENISKKIKKVRKKGKEKIYIPTGYLVSEIGESLRRKSPIIFSPLKSKEGKYYIAIIGFRTY